MAPVKRLLARASCGLVMPENGSPTAHGLLTRCASPPCLAVFPAQSLTSPQKPKAVGEGDDMAAVINDGLELYARELQQVSRGAGRQAERATAAQRQPDCRRGTAGCECESV